MGARRGLADYTLYCASKAALEGLTRALAVELGGAGHTVNCVAPGSVQTEKLDTLPEWGVRGLEEADADAESAGHNGGCGADRGLVGGGELAVGDGADDIGVGWRRDALGIDCCGRLRVTSVVVSQDAFVTVPTNAAYFKTFRPKFAPLYDQSRSRSGYVSCIDDLAPAAAT